MTRKTALIVCPGRGVYNAPELGYLRSHHADKSVMITRFDEQRQALAQPSIAELDGSHRFSRARLTRGDNASGLIYSCSIADFQSIDRDAYDIVAVTGNSMGWYTALAGGGALSPDDGFRVVNTMGTIMHEHAVGGQFVHPAMDADWRPDPAMREILFGLIEAIDGLYLSIPFGGMLVLAGTDAALAEAESRLDKIDGRFPMRLPNHGAFHTPLMDDNSRRGRTALPESLFRQPDLPLIDGRGAIWMPRAADLSALWDYTFGAQVTEPYDFTRAVQTGLKEFAPDCIIVLGPGNTLGGATAQAMLMCDWDGLTTKTEFIDRQATDPILLAMGHAEQRPRVT
ncbi:ACP S-malonyltransferase [Algimonas porphyrae]|uniref:[acyl-carrier-protein] S-malonyltransferase n=1 Tax=Algimonas porphyrae TaxID=1128113 RepID=A0ABQ5UWP5_9PROT|nr:ACP S-malonyltransferase [Algimonas porphyrae]GLQ19706.1 acyl carrier protein [Algimonas porphyrae]